MTIAAHIPTDWLEAFAVLISEDYSDAEDRFADRIAAIYRMRDIEQREGRHISIGAGEALAELAQRQDPDGSKRREAEVERRAAEIEALTAERAAVEEKIADYRSPLNSLLRRLEKIDARLNALRGD